MHAFAPDRAPATLEAGPPKRPLVVLDAIQIARPCPAEWEEMRPVAGQQRQRVRHCQQCNLRVYNLSAMKRADAEALVHASEGRMCVRLYRRDDGTVLTADCTYLRRAVNVSKEAARRAGWVAFCTLAAFIGAAAWAGSLLMERAASRGQATVMQSGLDRLAQMPMFDRIFAWAQPRQTGWVAGGMPPPMMGKIAMQGATAYEPPPPPEEAPHQWLDIDDEHRVPF